MRIRKLLQENKQLWIWGAILILSLVSIYLTKRFTFICDDYEILMSSQIHPFPFFSDWIPANIIKLSAISNLGMYRPLIVLSFYANNLISKNDPFAFYIFNILLHLGNTILLYKILLLVLKLFEFYSEKVKYYIIAGTALFFILPQNLMDVFWISGRTDIICEFFILSSSLFLISYFNNKNKKSYLILSITLAVLSYMSKETALLINLYVLIIILIYKHTKGENNLRILYLHFILSGLYLLYRFIIFHGSLLGDSKIPNLNFYEAFKFIIYGGWSLLIPFDILDYLYMLNNQQYLSALLLTIAVSTIIVILFYYLSKVLKYHEGKFVLLLFAVSFLSLLIYSGNFPSMRLMYVHIPLLLFACIILFYKVQGHSHTKIIFITLYSAIILFGISSFFYRTVKINDYYKKLWNILPYSKEISSSGTYIFPCLLNRVGQNCVAPPLKLMSNMKAFNNSNSDNRINFFQCARYETSSFSEVMPKFFFKTTSDSSFTISTNSSEYVFIPSNYKKFDKAHLTTELYDSSISIKPLNFINLLDRKSTKVMVYYNLKKDWDNVKFIYWVSGNFKIISFNKFMEELKHNN